MKTKPVAWIVMVSVMAFGAASPPVDAQPAIPPLPADLLFTTTTLAEGDLPRDIIVRVDAETLDISPFYVDQEAFEILPISWSPHGDLLALYRRMPPLDEGYTLFPRQLCILTRDGALQRCMDDSPPMHWGGDPESWQEYFPVAWGPDGQTIYFFTEYPNPGSVYGYGRHLVEASVLTGETLRAIYGYPDPYPISPSPDLNHATVGFGGIWYSPDAPAFLVDLTTSEQVDIPSVVPNHTKLDSTCWSFSPNGNYIVASVVYGLAAYAPEQDPSLHNGFGYLLLILDMQGTIQGLIGQPDGENTLWSQSCPGWQADEQAIVFWASGSEKAYIMRYSLPDQQLTTLSELKPWPAIESSVNTPLIPTPDGRYVAFTVSDLFSGDRLVAVLYPDGELRLIPSPYRFGLYPLWVPPLDDPSPE